MTRRFVMWLVVGMLVAPAFGHAASMSSGTPGAKWTWSLTPDYTASSWTSEMGWGNRAGQKLLFGVKNLLLGWTELFTEPKEAIDSGENFFVGLGRGVVSGVGQTVGGVLHGVTFPITALDVTLPEGGTQLL